MKKENIKKGTFFTINTNTEYIFQIKEILENTAIIKVVLSPLVVEFSIEFLIKDCTEVHWTDGIRLWDKYKKQKHTIDELFDTLEDFFGTNRDSELSKLMAYKFMNIHNF